MKEETAGTDDCHEARGIVELFSASPLNRGHCDWDVGDIMSACQRAQTNKPIRSQWVNMERRLRLLSVHVHYSIRQHIKFLF